MSAQPMVVAAARKLADLHAEACNVDPVDVWTIHAEEFQQDAAAALDAAGAPDLLKELEHAVRWFDQITPADVARYKAAIAKAKGEAAC